jgi:hypothetical protein
MAKIAKKIINVEGNSVSFKFSDGSEITANLNELSQDTLKQVALHGISAKLGDSYAGAGDVEEEGGDPIAWAKAEVARIWANLKAGLWSVRSEGGVRVTVLAQAVAAVYNISPEAAAEKLSEMDEEKKKALSAAPKIAAKVAGLKAEAAAKRAAAAQAALSSSGEDLPSL